MQLSKIGALQRTWEFGELLSLVRRRRPRVVVEIGTHRGGSLFAWSRVAAADALLIAIDYPEAGGLGARPEDDAKLRAFVAPSQQLEIVRGDSHAPDTFALVSRSLGSRAIDLLWIDGDHSDAGVRADWDMYGPLVRRDGGLVAFHDVHPDREYPFLESWRLWRELRDRHRHREFIEADVVADAAGMGIGVLLL